MKIDWSKAPEGATHYYKNSPQPWRDLSGCVWKYFSHGEWLLASPAGKSAWLLRELGTVLFARPLPQTWTGEGLPPIGIDVEIHNKTGLSVVEGAEGFIGSKCTVMATFTNMHGYEIVSVEDDSGSCMCFRAHMCFPVRTPEQVAADERKVEIDAMYRIFYEAPGLASQGGIAALYDAGYRKQPAP